LLITSIILEGRKSVQTIEHFVFIAFSSLIIRAKTMPFSRQIDILGFKLDIDRKIASTFDFLRVSILV
jgi:hypothetical protein